MTSPYPLELAGTIGESLRKAREDLVARWLERISARVTLDSEKIFPGEELLNHVPLLIAGIAEYVERSDADLDEGAPVVAKAMELGALRHRQGFDAYQILKEYEILGGILCSFVLERVERGELECSPADVLMCWQRISHAVEMIRQATMTHFLRLSAERVKDREERLRRFNRMVSHELKNRVGAIRGAADLLGEEWVAGDERQRFRRMVIENADGLQHVLNNLEVISRTESDSRQRRNVLLPQATAEAVRQVRGMAQSRSVDVQVAEELPAVEVDAAATELCLANYVSNAVKYSDPTKPHRWVHISATLSIPTVEAAGELSVYVTDNGIGVPQESRANLFNQFYRAHDETVTDVEGTGLGLSIVRETVESLGGRAWAEFPEEGGAVFAFALPSRREEDAAAAGTRRLEPTTE